METERKDDPPKRRRKNDFVILTPPIKAVDGEIKPTVESSKVTDAIIEKVKKVFKAPYTKYGG